MSTGKRVALGVALGVLGWTALAATIGLVHIAELMLAATLLAALTFCVVYARRHWKTPIGWNIMAMGVVLVIETSLAIAATAFGTDWPHRDLIRAVAWALIASVLWWRVWLVAFPPRTPPPDDEPLSRASQPNRGEHHD